MCRVARRLRVLGSLDLRHEFQTCPLTGNCLKRSDWKLALRTEGDQCTQSDAKNFPSKSDQDRASGEERYTGGYTPEYQVLKDLSDITGGRVTVEQLERIQILSGINATDPDDQENLHKALGQWCSMPAPNTGDQGIFPKEQADDYWQKCVMPDAGYLNVLVCEPPGSNFSAVLGLMATNPDVCYPLHAHVANEVYWQVGGRAGWRTWEKCSNATAMRKDLNITPPDGRCLVSGPLESWESAYSSESNSSAWHQKNLTTSKWEYKHGLSPHWHPSPVVHETDTTADGTTHLLNFYLWAKSSWDNTTSEPNPNQYHTGLGYFDMHQVFEALNGTNNASRDDRARELIGTCAKREHIPSIFHEEWQPNLHQWLSPLTNWTPPAVQCPDRRTRPPPPPPLAPPVGSS